MKKIAFPLAASISAILLSATFAAKAQQLSISQTPIKQISVMQFSENYKRYLEEAGYTAVILTSNDKGFGGSAMKGGKKVAIVFDDRGALRINDLTSASAEAKE